MAILKVCYGTHLFLFLPLIKGEKTLKLPQLYFPMCLNTSTAIDPFFSSLAHSAFLKGGGENRKKGTCHLWWEASDISIKFIFYKEQYALYALFSLLGFPPKIILRCIELVV